MFILIPLSLIVLSILGIALIIFRKKSYISKLYTLNTAGLRSAVGFGEASGSNVAGYNFGWKSYGADFFPEIKVLIDKLELGKYKVHWLVEAEKFFRKARVMSLKLDRMSDSMIKKIRKIHLNDQLNGHAAKEAVELSINTKDEGPMEKVNTTDGAVSMTFLKNEEQTLIIEIARNPKDAGLYEQLGDIYMEMGNWTDAKESYEASIELNPQDGSLKQKLSSALEKLSSQS